MNIIHMFAVLLLLSVALYFTMPLFGVAITFQQAFVGLAAAKAIALFLVPEKPPMVLVKSRTEIEEDAE